MWNMLIVLIIAAAVWFYTPHLNFSSNLTNSYKSNAKQQKTAKDITNGTINEVNNARLLQKQQQDSLNN